MQSLNLINYTLNGELFSYCKEQNLFDILISSKEQPLFPTGHKNASTEYMTYGMLWRDFSLDWALAKLLTGHKKILLICDEFSVHELNEILPLIQQRIVRTVVLNLGSWTSGLLTKWAAETKDIDLILESGIPCMEPADVITFQASLFTQEAAYIRIADKEIPTELFPGKKTPAIFSATTEQLADPSITMLCWGYLFQEALSLADRAEQLGQQPALFCIQQYNAELPSDLITSLERSERCVILIDQDESSDYGDYLASKLPPVINEKLSFHFITPDTEKITSHYAEVLFEQAGIIL